MLVLTHFKQARIYALAIINGELGMERRHIGAQGEEQLHLQHIQVSEIHCLQNMFT